MFRSEWRIGVDTQPGGYRGLVRRAVLALLVLLAGCGGEQATTDPPAATTTKAAPASTRPVERKPSRPPALPIEGETLDGQPLSLASFRGRPVFVLVWSSW